MMEYHYNLSNSNCIENNVGCNWYNNKFGFYNCNESIKRITIMIRAITLQVPLRTVYTIVVL